MNTRKRLELELTAARMELAAAKTAMDSMNLALGPLVGHLRNLEGPHYLTLEERKLYEQKGFEVLLLHFQDTMKKLDEERAKLYPSIQ